MKDFTLVAILFGLCDATALGQWQPQAVDTQSDFRGLAVASPEVVWASGTRGTYARTTDRGKNWSVGTVPGAEKLDFRDVKAFGRDTAYLLSAGPGDASRVYKTTDGGKSWVMQFKCADPRAFFDAIAFWDEKNGIALGDPVDGRFQLIATDDGGANWKPLAAKALPPALPGEGAFAASGTCVVARGESDAWFVTGGARTARVFRSRDRGRNWEVSEMPVAAGAASAGIFSIAFRDRDHGMIVGGDYRKPDAVGATAAITADGGKTWVLLDRRLPFRSAVAWAKDRWVAVGTSGSDASRDDGATWTSLDKENYNSVGFTPTGEGWAVGPKGRVAAFANKAPMAPVARTDPNSKTAHEQLLAKAKAGRIDVYFVGDSITRRWGATDYPDFLANWKQNFYGWNAADFGWGGDTVQNVLWRLRNGELDGVNPKVIVVMAGTNNLGGLARSGADEAKADEVVQGLKSVLATCQEKAPKAVVILMGITPRNDIPAAAAVIDGINARLSGLADGKGVRYLNINDKLADREGKFLEGMSPDRLHLSAKGYQVWAEALKPILNELLGPPAKEDLAPPPTGDPSAAGRPVGPPKK